MMSNLITARKGYKPATVNHRMAVITAYMKYAASRKVAIYQVYMNVLEVPYVTVPSKVKEIIEDKETIKKLLASPGMSDKGIRDQIILPGTKMGRWYRVSMMAASESIPRRISVRPQTT